MGHSRIRDLEVDHGVDRHHRLVGGDDRLRREVRNLLTQVDTGCDAIHEGDEEVETTLHHGLVTSQTLDDVRLRLRNDADRADKRYNDKDDEGKDHDERDIAKEFC